MMLFIISAVLLVIVLIRTRPGIRLFGCALVQVIFAAVLLFLFNGTGLSGDLYIPINLVTVLTVAALGIPGLVLLAAVKATILPL